MIHRKEDSPKMLQTAVSRTTSPLFIVSILVASILTSAVSTVGTQETQQVAPSSIAGKPDYVVVMMMENHGINSIIGNSSAPYMNQLATSYSLAKHYTALTHPSLSNYLAIMLGSLPNCTTDPNPNSGCATTVWKNQSLINNLESHQRSWKAYMESMPSNCYNKDSGPSTAPYYVRHDPFVYFSNVANIPARCSRVVPAGASDSVLISDLSSKTTASNLMWLTPNGCNDMHDCGVSTGDSYLKQLVPSILNSNVFQTQNAALFITFDEGNNYYPTDYVYTLWAGPSAKTGFQSSQSYGHFSFLKTLESIWNLPSMSSGDAAATPMTEFFTSSPPGPLQASFTYSPLSPLTGRSISFTGSATGGQPPYTFKWDFGDSTPTVTQSSTTHSYSKESSYIVTMYVNDSIQQTAHYSQTITVTTLPLPLNASIAYSPAFPTPDDNISFTGIANGGTFPYAYSWKFGDGLTAHAETAYHQYRKIGSYNVSLTITDSKNVASSTSQLLNVTSAEPLTAGFDYAPAAPIQGRDVSFSATAVGGDPPYTYSWSLGDGTTLSGSIISHRYSAHGVYNVSLTAADSSGGATVVSKIVQVNGPGSPVANCSLCPFSMIWLSMVGAGVALVAIVSVVAYAVRSRSFKPTAR